MGAGDGGIPTELDERLRSFLDDHDKAAKEGVTLPSLYRITRNLADALTALEQKESTRWENLKKELLSIRHRLRNLEGEDPTTLENRVRALETEVETIKAALPLRESAPPA